MLPLPIFIPIPVPIPFPVPLKSPHTRDSQPAPGLEIKKEETEDGIEAEEEMEPSSLLEVEEGESGQQEDLVSQTQSEISREEDKLRRKRRAFIIDQ